MASKKFDRNHKAVLQGFYARAIEGGVRQWTRLINGLKKSLRDVDPEAAIIGWQPSPLPPDYLSDYLAKVLLTSNLLGQATFWQDLMDKGLARWARSQKEPPAGLPFMALSEFKLEAETAKETEFGYAPAAATGGAAWIELKKLGPLDSDRAYEFFKSKVPMTRVQFDRLSQLAKNEAFTIAGTENIALIGQVKEVAQSALREGLTQHEFKKEAWELFDAAGVTKTSPWHLETVFRTNVCGAYNAARWEQTFQGPTEAVEKFVPYLEYSTTGGGNVCEICEQYNGKVYRRDDPIWDNIYPPNHHNCECLVAPVSVFEAIDEGLKPDRIYPDTEGIQFKSPPSALGRKAA